MTFFHSLDPKDILSWNDLYARLKNLCLTNKKEAGTAFEYFCKAYYLCEPTVKDQYKNVWLGLEAPLQILQKLNHWCPVKVGLRAIAGVPYF